MTSAWTHPAHAPPTASWDMSVPQHCEILHMCSGELAPRPAPPPPVNTCIAITRAVSYFIWGSKMDRVKEAIMFKEPLKGSRLCPTSLLSWGCSLLATASTGLKLIRQWALVATPCPIFSPCLFEGPLDGTDGITQFPIIGITWAILILPRCRGWK